MRAVYSLILICGLFLLGFNVWSANEARKTITNNVVDWLPNGTQELETYINGYYVHFPEGELVMASWQGCNADDPRLDTVAEKLLQPVAADALPYFKRVTTTRSMLAELQEPPLDLTVKAAYQSLKGWLLGRNGKDGGLIALISENGGQHRGQAIESIFAAIEESTGLSRSEIYAAGPSTDSVAIDQIASVSQQRLLPFFLLFCFALLLACLRSVFFAVVVFSVALMCEELGCTLLYWTGTRADSISMLISSLIYVLTISGGIHLVNYYRETLQDMDCDKAPRETMKKAVLPCTLASVTTIFGLGSLAVSKMVPIRTFGIFASLSLFLGTIALFLILYSVFHLFPARHWQRTPYQPDLPEKDSFEQPAPAHRTLSRLNSFVSKFRRSIVVLAALIMVLGSVGVSYLRTTVSFHAMLPHTAKVIQDYEILEERFGGLIPVEVVLRIPDEVNTPSLLEQAYFVEEVKKILQEPIQTEAEPDTMSVSKKIDKNTAEISAIVSALNFMPVLPSRSDRSFRSTSRRAAIAAMLTRRVALLEDTCFYARSDRDDPQGAASYWRLSLRLSSQKHYDYACLLQVIRQRLDDFSKAESASNSTGLSFIVTGGVPLVHYAQQQLLEDLIWSFLTAFGTIALIMILLLRGICRGLLSMVPNIFPCVLVFGVLGWLNIPIDMGSMMTASVAMGIAVDGTLHYLTWFNISLRKGKSRQESVVDAFKNCAPALVQTTIVCGFGMLVFGMSDFIPMARFAVMMCTLLTASLIGDIIIFPAILLSPLGRLFE